MDMPTNLCREQMKDQPIVEIRLWGFYLLLNRSALYNEMIDSSIDQGPVEKEPQPSGRVTFRFEAKAWETRIKKLLYGYRIPVVLKTGIPLRYYVDEQIARFQKNDLVRTEVNK